MTTKAIISDIDGAVTVIEICNTFTKLFLQSPYYKYTNCDK